MSAKISQREGSTAGLDSEVSTAWVCGLDSSYSCSFEVPHASSEAKQPQCSQMAVKAQILFSENNRHLACH